MDTVLTGKWTITDATGALADTNKGTVYEFMKDGTLVLSLGGFKNTATYTITGDKVSYSVGTITTTAMFTITGDVMNFEIVNSDQKFVMKRGK